MERQPGQDGKPVSPVPGAGGGNEHDPGAEGAVSPGHGEHGGLPKRLRGRMPLWAAGHGPGGRGSNRGSVAAGTAGAAGTTGTTGTAERAAGGEETAEAGGITNQAAGRACKDGKAGTATGREVALPGGDCDPPARAGGHGPEPDGCRDGDGQGHPGGGVCIQERLSPGGEKNGRGAGTAWA